MQPEISALSINNAFAVLSLPDASRGALPHDVRDAFRFFARPEVQQMILELQRTIFDFIVSAPDPLEAIDWQNGRGNYVREGVREMLMAPQADGGIPLALSRFGGVDLIAAERRLAIGEISLAADCPIFREEFVNKSSAQRVEKPVFQLQQVSSWVPLRKILEGDKSGFILNDRQALAAEIVMTMDYLFIYAQIADDILRNEQDAGEVLLKMKVGANLEDCFAAARYCRSLEERFIGLISRVDLKAQWALLSGPLKSI